MNYRWFFGVCFLLTLSGGAAAVWWNWREPSSSSSPPATRSVISRAVKPPRPSEDYVGSASCATCHAEIAESYSHHPMWNSLGPISTEAPYFSESLIKPDGMCSYQVETKDGEMFHHEIMRDSSGQVIYDQPVHVDYAIGSGARGWSFLLARRDLLFMSPLTWYTTAGKWDLSPGYHADDPLRFNRRVEGDCLHCHSGRVALEPNRESRYKTPPFLEASIGCERCHGPGKEHVAFHETGAGRDVIVNPASLPRRERESVCDQCHLQAEARIPRYGRTHLDFRPGQKLSDVITVLTLDYGVEQSARAVRHVQQMHASRCYQASDGRMGCTSCHDPHSLPGKDAKITFYRGKCIACHDQEPHCGLPEAQRRERSPQDSCVQCHMPHLQAADVGHTAQTDHRILRDPAASPLATEAPEQKPDLAFFEGMKEPLEPWEANRALGLAMFHNHPASGAQRVAQLQRIESLLAPALERAADDAVALSTLGAVYVEQQRPDEAQSLFRRALRLDGQDESALFGLAKTALTAGDREAAVRGYDQLLAVNDSSAEAHARKAELLGELTRWEEGIEAAEKALQLNPRLASMRAWLVDAYRNVGRNDLAAAHYAILERMGSVWRGPHPGGSSRTSN